MSKYIQSNVTPEVFFKYHCTDSNAVEFYESGLEYLTSEDEENKEEIARLENRRDKLQEMLEDAQSQVEHAQELIEKIAEALELTTAKEIKADIKRAIKLSLFKMET